MTAPIADGVQTAFAIELLIAEQARAVNTQNLGQVFTLGQALRHHHGADETLGRRIVARATHQRAGGVHEDELFGRLQEDIARSARRFQQLGQDILSGGTPVVGGARDAQNPVGSSPAPPGAAPVQLGRPTPGA
jgi:hypothetical protein